MKIPFTKFIQRLCDNKSARIASVSVKTTGGAFVPDYHFIEQELAKVETLKFRTVEHRQSNAIRFVGGSWLMFDKPKRTNRQCYSITIGETEYLLMVTHREPGTNDFGTPISEWYSVLMYQIGK